MSSSIPNIEKEIVAHLENEDRKAIDLAYKNYGKALYGIILRIVKSSEIAEEVLQDVFVKIWVNAKSYNKSKGIIQTKAEKQKIQTENAELRKTIIRSRQKSHRYMKIYKNL